jgi:tRNA(Ile)-lysidine synthetase-like protein
MRPPVIVRTRRGGDRLPTAGGTRSLKEILSQWAVPWDARDDAAVVADSRGVAAVIALPWGARAADREDSEGRSSLSLTSMRENGAECAKQ